MSVFVKSPEMSVALDKKSEEFAKVIEKKSETIFDNYDDSAIMTILRDNDKQYLYYFIGRMNPPHSGHIFALQKLVETANKNSSVPLILVGSGPKGERTLDNPIPFELKQEFIRSKVKGIYILEEMTSPTSNVSRYVKRIFNLMLSIKDFKKLDIIHMAGDKEGDSTKLNFIKPFAESAAKSIKNDIVVTTGTRAITPLKIDGEEMSATKVRKDAYSNFINGIDFKAKYKDFYGEFTDRIYDAIIEPAKGLEKEQIEDYINTGKLPKITKSTTRKPKRKLSKGGKRRTKKC